MTAKIATAQSQQTSRFHNSMHLGQRCLWWRNVFEHSRRPDSVERSVLKRQCVGVGDLKLDVVDALIRCS